MRYSVTMEELSFEDCPIGNMRFEKNLPGYNLSARVGEYYQFDYTKISNEMHRHDCFELVLVLNGRGTFYYEGRSFVLREGSLFLSDPGCEHEIHINQNENMTLLYLMFSIRKKHGRRSLSHEEKILDRFFSNHKNIVENQKLLFSYILFFEEYIRNNGFGTDPWFVMNLENFLFHCLDLSAGKKPDSAGLESITGDLFEKALDYIDKNLSTKINADMISAGINTSKRNLYRLFQKNMNRSVNDYVNERKIYLAEYYLQMNMSVTESAALVGIENLSQFNKLFHRYLNISPRRFKTEFHRNPGGYGRRMQSPPG